jgi:hypothetical protein
MKLKIKKTDRRFKGYPEWKYYVDLNPRKFKNETDTDNFFAVREWCWTTWGASKEVDRWFTHYLDTTGQVSQNQNWCWHLDDYTARIYLKDAKQADWFTLKWV